ncbi:DNA mismatch repair protein MutS [Candidatus Entotheonellaceae bacterium PAL068K]
MQRLTAISQRYSQGRWAVVLVGIPVTLLVENRLGAVCGWIAAGLFVAGFILLAAYHGRVKESMVRHEIWRHLKATHVARLSRDWAGIPRRPSPSPEADHPFEADLNITGPRSVHQLLDTTLSGGGSERLRDWLLHPLTDPERVRARQEMVRELVPLATFRDRLALHGTRVAAKADEPWPGEAVLTWLQRHPVQTSGLAWVIVLGLLAATNLTLYGLSQLALVPTLWPFSLVLYLGLYLLKSGEVRHLFADAFRLEKTLHPFRAVLSYLETYSYCRTPRVAELCRPFWRAEARPSGSIKRIERLAGAASAQKANIFGLLLNVLAPWNLYVAYRLNQCREEVKNVLPVWMETWYELEALNALANLGYLHPDYVFPDFLPVAVSEAQPLLRANAIGHPLLPDETRVCNDFVLDPVDKIVMLTGSNMSGKSTFLRTLGVNLCLAFAGSPVNASHLQTVPFRLFTCINVSDSVTDGISYFYAEVRRLKALLQALQADHPYPLFWLIDEIFRGTNNRERLIGSRSYVRALAADNGVGLISTHDLELVSLVDEVAGIRHCHFREQVQDDRMVFDYRLRSGPCPTTNALTIMQLAGLPLRLARESRLPY